MTINEKSTLLGSDGYIASYTDENGVGVTYFKLNPSPKFGADYTKGCGLLGEDIDKNFYFLRGYDISGITIDDDKNLIITRVNPAYRPLKVNLAQDVKYSFEFDKENGTLIVTTPDGEEINLDGFLVEGKDIRIATDYTITGNGTIYSPLSISEVEKTGTYAPADEYLDITKSTSGIPTEYQKREGYRVVTKETIDNFGMLYPFEGVKQIDADLKAEKSQWRVATKDDWDNLLNALEDEDEYRNHSASTEGFFGDVAGSKVKSDLLWEDYDEETKGQDTVGLSLYPLGKGTSRYAVKDNNDNKDVERFRAIGAIWTSTETSAKDQAYDKEFYWNQSEVYQGKLNKKVYCSVRLCKDYTYSNSKSQEVILGNVYPCVDVKIECADYHMIWTKINFGNSEPQYLGYASTEWDAAEDVRNTKEVYFINEWTGTEWVKKQMNDGDSVVIINYEDAEGNVTARHEWRIEEESLVDTISSVEGEVSGYTKELVDEETKRAIGVENAISEAVDTERAERIDADDKIREDISAATSSSTSAITALEEQIYADISAITEEFSAKTVAIEEEISYERVRAIDVENAISGAVDTERTERIEAIKEEEEERKANDIATGEYTLTNEGVEIPTNGGDASITISIDDDFFNFGKF